MSENKAQAFLRQSLVISPMDRMDRVENVLLLGMPDVSCCIEGKEFWIENKQPIEPKRTSTPLFGSNHKFSVEQKNWFLQQSNAGGNAFAFIWTDKRGILLPAYAVQEANGMTIDELTDNCIWTSIKPVPQHIRQAMRTALLARCR